jgi:hypothetical protein
LVTALNRVVAGLESGERAMRHDPVVCTCDLRYDRIAPVLT